MNDQRPSLVKAGHGGKISGQLRIPVRRAGRWPRLEQGSLDETDDTAIDAISKICNRGKKPGSPGRRRSA